MKKRFLIFLLAGLMLLSLATPALAVDVIPAPTGISECELMQQVGIELEPRTEQTEIHWRTWQGQLQFRVWGVTSGRWLTDWINFIA